MSDLAPVGTALSVARKLRIAGMELTVSSAIPQPVVVEVLDLLIKAEELLVPANKPQAPDFLFDEPEGWDGTRPLQ